MSTHNISNFTIYRKMEFDFTSLIQNRNHTYDRDSSNNFLFSSFLLAARIFIAMVIFISYKYQWNICTQQKVNVCILYRNGGKRCVRGFISFHLKIWRSRISSFKAKADFFFRIISMRLIVTYYLIHIYTRNFGMRCPSKKRYNYTQYRWKREREKKIAKTSKHSKILNAYGLTLCV